MEYGFIKKNSIIHRINPSLKFVTFIVMIAMVFLPLGFFAQLIIGLFLITIYLFAKIGIKTFFNIIKSILLLFLLLLLINWCLYKDPIAVQIPDNYFAMQIGSNKLITNCALSDGNSYVSNLWGGKIFSFLTPDMLQLPDGTSLTVSNVLEKGITLEGVHYSALQLSGSSIYNSENSVVLENNVVLYQSNWYTLSPYALQLALYVSIKVFLMILAATILTTTTSSIELTYALEDILSPLKIVKFPVAEVSMMIAIALRFVPSLLVESQRILNAQSSRGIDFKNGNFIDKIRSMVSLIVPLFNISFQKSMDLASAMEARSYNPRYSRTRYRKYNVTIIDWIIFGILCLLFGFLIGITINKLFFSPFGLFELSVLIG